MRRPNLARERFENSRPVWVLGAVMACAALAMTAHSVWEALGAKGVEMDQLTRVEQLRAEQTRLSREVERVERELAAVGWRKLRTETAALQDVVVQRRLSWSRMLADLERVLPWDVRLFSISPSPQKDGTLRLRLQAVAVSRESWLGFVARLFVDPAFSDPLPGSEDTPGKSGGQGHAVALSVSYWPQGRP